MMDIYEKIHDLYDRKEKLSLAVGTSKIDKQHEKGKLTARERIDLLVIREHLLNSILSSNITAMILVLINEKAPGDGVVTGFGKVNGRPIYLFSQDFTVFGGALRGNACEENCQCNGFSCKKWCTICRS